MTAPIARSVFLVANTGFTVTNFRRDLVQTLKRRGHRVTVVCPADDATVAVLRELEVRHVSLPLSRKGTNPLAELHTYWFLRRLFERRRPDVVLNYTIKPVIYGSLAAEAAGVPNVYSFVTGLGYLFTGQSARRSALRQAVRPFYKRALKANSKVFFQNPDDRQVFLDMGLILEHRTKIISGSGVNLEAFRSANVARAPGSFILVGRLLRDKGVGEYAAAARLVRAAAPSATCYLLGPFDEHPSAISPRELESWVREGIIEYLGVSDDVRSVLDDKEVFVLPSYREGTPRSALEALALGMPIITTDAPGCRETVIEGVNGHIVPIKDHVSLARAMLQLVDSRDKSAMGEASLAMARERFDVRRVNASILEEMPL